MLETHSPERAVKVAFSVPDSIAWVSGSVTVLDENETALQQYTMTEGDWSNIDYTYTVAGELNTVPDTGKGLRTVELLLVDEDGITYEESARYLLVSDRRLAVGANTLLNFTQALLMVPDLTRMEGWIGANDDDRKAALREAYDMLSLYALSSDFEHKFISDYTADEFNALSERVRQNFQRAQMIQADYLLGGDPVAQLREAGVISNSAGESTMFMRTGNKLNRGLSDRAYRYISTYVSHAVRLVNA